MKRIIQLALFLSLFFSGYLAINYYIFYRMGILLDIPTTTIYTLIILFTLSYPVAALLERTVSHIFTRILYTISSVWIGISFFILFLLFIYEIVKFIFNISPFTAGVTIIAFALVISIYSIINSMLLEIKEVEIVLSNLKRDMKVVQLSDIHIGSIRNSGFLERIVDKTNKLKPDIVLITGDMVDGSAKLHKHTFCALDKLDAPVLFVTGNHESYEGLEEVYRVLNPTKTKILRNEIVELSEVQIIGIDHSFDRDHLKETIKSMKIEENRPSILMYHLPGELKTANEAGIDLQLSGHTHNGQVFPFNFIVKLFFPYISGLYEYNGTYLYVSPGTGTWGPPMRLGSKNEITLINLKKK